MTEHCFKMDKKKLGGIIVALVIFIAICIWLSDLMIYTLIAFLVSMIGRPIVKVLHNKLKFPHSLGSITAIVTIAAFLVGIGWLILPMLLRQGQEIINFDYSTLTNTTYVGFQQLDLWLNSHGIYLSETQLQQYLTNWMQQILQEIHVQEIVSNTITLISSFSVGLFCVLFIAFFFLKDERLFKKILFLFIPDHLTEKAGNILISSERLLTRYFVGLSIEVICMMLFLSLGLWAFGIENSLLFGCLGGLLNIIPYVGPVIGTVLATVFALINHLDAGFSMELVWMASKVIGVFVCSNLIDNFVLQPLIYSNSVKAHPLEIFFVILIAGTLTGTGGMILAIPTYTVLRIIAKEFFKNSKLVKELTRNL